MTDGIEFYRETLDVDLNQAAEVVEYLQQRRAWDNSFTVEDVMNLASFGRAYPGVSPDLAVGALTTRMPWDDPVWADVALADAAEQERSAWRTFTDAVGGGLKAGTRTLDLVVEGVWEEMVSRPGRAVARVWSQDEGAEEAWRRAGESDLGMALGNLAQGEPVNLGTGWMANSTLAHESKEFGPLFQDFRAQGMEVDQARRAAQEAWYGEHGSPLTYEGQLWRESTLIAKTHGETTHLTPWSWGRGPAIQVFEPGTGGFQAMSAAGDIGMRLVADPFNLLAPGIGQAFKARNLIVADEAIGAFASWRPGVHGRTASEFLDSRRGQRFLNYLAENDFYKVWPLLEPMGADVARQVARTNDPSVVADLIMPYLGTEVTSASALVPRSIGSPIWGAGRQAIEGMAAVGSQMEWAGPRGLRSIHNGLSGLSTWGQRMAATSRGNILNPMNKNEVVRTAKNWMDTAGIQPSQQEEILTFLARRGNTYRGVTKGYQAIARATGDRLAALGYDAQDVRYIMEQMFDEQTVNRIYMHDATGNLLDDGLKGMRFEGPEGDVVELYRHGAHLDSELADQMLILPDLRHTRIITAKTRRVRNKLRKQRGTRWYNEVWQPDKQVNPSTGILLGSGPLASLADKGMSTWRNFALLRGGWPFRILLDEMARWQASGMTDRNPLTSFLYMTFGHGKRDMLDVTGEALIDSLTPKSLGAGGWAMDLEMRNMTRGTRFDATRTSWTMEDTRRLVRKGDPEKGIPDEWAWTQKGRRGMAREWHQLASSELARRVAESGVDDAFEFFTKTDEGREIIEAIAGAATRDNPLAYLTNDAVLLRKLQSVHARIEMMIGGDIRYFDETAGVWKNSLGQVVDEADIARHGLDTAEDLRYVVVKDGDANLRQMLHTGRDADGVTRLGPEMSPEEWRDLEDWIPNAFGEGYVPPVRVKAPSPLLDARVHNNLEHTVGNLFRWLGEIPTVKLLREGFAIERYIDHAAEYYVRGNFAARKGLDDWMSGIENAALQKRWAKAKRTAERKYGRAAPMPEGRVTVKQVVTKKGEEPIDMEAVRQVAPPPPPEPFTADELAEIAPELTPHPVENYSYHGSWALYDEEAMKSGGIARDPGRAAGYATGDDGRVYIIDHESLPPAARERLESGMDIEQLVTESEWRELGEEAWEQFVEQLDQYEGFAQQVAEDPDFYITEHTKFMDQWMSTVERSHAESYHRDWLDAMSPGGVLRTPPEAVVPDDTLFPIGDMTRAQAEEAARTGRLPAGALYDERVDEALIPSQESPTGFPPSEFSYEDLDEIVRDDFTPEEIHSLMYGTPDEIVEILQREGPDLGDEIFSYAEIDAIAKRKALEDTKNLFYDLNNKGNWADATRLIFPFAEAWWEVLQTWSRMLLPGLGPRGLPQDIGRVAKNWRRIQTSYRTAQGDSSGSGFFSEDQFGNEVFNFPGFGMLMGVPHMQTNASLDQIMFLDPTSIRGTFMPGTGPLVQIGARLVDPLLDETSFVGRMFDNVVYGSFEPAQGAGAIDQFLTPLLPTWGKRALQKWYGPEFRRQYGDELLQLFSIMLHEAGADRDLSPENARKMMEQLRPMGNTLAWARFFDSLVWPAQTRYDPGIVVEMAGHERFISLAAISKDWAAARNVYNDDAAATRYMIETYGLDPLNLTGKTHQVTARPLTEEGFRELELQPETKEHFPLLLMAVVGESPHGEFYGDAWRDQLDEGARVHKDWEYGARLISQQIGNRSYRAMIEIYDREVEKLKATYPAGTQGRTQGLQALNEWKERQKMAIGMQHFNWEPGAGAWGAIGRPSLGNMIEELRLGGTPGTDANTYLRETYPETARFFEFATDLWDKAEQASRESPYASSSDWWRTTTAVDNPTSASGARATELREWVMSNLNYSLDQIEDPQARRGAEWLTENLFSRLINGYHYDEILFIEPEPPPALPESEITGYFQQYDPGVLTP